MQGEEDYKIMLSELIQKQMVVLGPNIAVDTARQVPGLEVGEDGGVTQLAGDPEMVLKSLANEYVTLSGEVARMTLGSTLEKYPEIKGSQP